MNEPASSSRRCPHCGAANALEAASCASCKHSLPLAESEEPTGYFPAADREAPTELGAASGPPEPGESETATEYSPASATGGAPRSLRDEGPLEVGQKLGRYRIIKLLGLGGMGAVYRAWDEELGVGVAVKIVRPEIATDPEAARDLEKRFKRELLLARQVTHPNVVRIHDMGEIDGIKYITMPYVEGVELSSILKENERGLPIEQVLTVARGVVSGLVAAHRRGRRSPGPQAGQHHGRNRHRPGHDHGLRDRPVRRRGRSRRERPGSGCPRRLSPPASRWPAPSSGRWSTWPRSSSGARRWTTAPTSTPSA